MSRPAPSITPLPQGGPELAEAARWAEARLDRALLVLGDLTAPLRPMARHLACRSGEGALRGLAVRFEGFPDPVASVAADDAEAAAALVEAIGGGAVLVAGARQVVPASLRDAAPADPWMVGPCTPAAAAEEPLRDPAEVGDLLRRAGMRFWCPAMLQFGHAFGVRDPGGRLVAAAGVNFVLEDAGYAHLGPLVTDPGARGRSLGSRALAAVRASLAEAGIARCGLFADGGRAELVAYYERRGFQAAGAFRFLTR